MYFITSRNYFLQTINSVGSYNVRVWLKKKNLAKAKDKQKHYTVY